MCIRDREKIAQRGRYNDEAKQMQFLLTLRTLWPSANPSKTQTCVTNPMPASRTSITTTLFDPPVTHWTNSHLSQLYLHSFLLFLSLHLHQSLPFNLFLGSLSLS